MSFFVLAADSVNWGYPSEWEDFLAYILFVGAGLCIGYALRGLVGRWQAETIERKMRLREEAADQEVKTRLKEADVQARSIVLKAREDFEKTARERNAEMQAAEDRLNARAENLDTRSAEIDARERAAAAAAAAAAKAADDAGAARRDADARLEGLAGMTRDEAAQRVLARAEEETREEAAAVVRQIQEDARNGAEAAARNIIVDAIGHCAIAQPSPSVTTVVQIPDDDMKGRIIGRDGRNIRTFEGATGVTVILDDSPGIVVLSCFDAVRRETARRALEALIADGRIHPARIEDAVQDAAAAVESAHLDEGAAAAAEARVTGLPDSILRALGMLRFKYSWGQNALRHSVEVAVLAGKFASELGIDAAKARRAGLLHDIGKGLPDLNSAPHAAAGAAFLKAEGEAEDITLAVAAHHPEAHLNGGVLGTLCAAADAISAARPGARNESEVYAERLERIEAIAMAEPGVEKAFAVQAGRDVRVIVNPEKISDADAQLLAQKVCRGISASLRFPGRIRVTVVRETRHVEYAG